jgi:transposase
MRQVREVLQLKFVGDVATREIARRLGVAPSTVRLTLKRFAAAGLSWPLGDEITDEVLEAKLFGGRGTKQRCRRHAEPDWAAIHRELKRKHVTLMTLWEEYIEREPGGYRYSRFCELHRSFQAKLSVTMRQTHVGGEKLFVDYAGDNVPVIIDRLTGEIRDAQIFVAVMGASNFVYAEATWSQGLGDWIGAHTRALEAIGGVPHLVVPDNAKVAVIKACLYEPQVNRTYTDMAAHYGTAILPTRPRRPRDKAKVEGCVLIVERWLLGRLRNRIFHSLAELNRARGLDRALFNKLATGSWIDAHDNLILCGPAGIGKSWLACALGHKACRDNRSVLYQRIPKLFADLALARGDGRYARLLRALGGVQLLILDDWGLQPLEAAARQDILEILEDRYGRRSTIITSQIPVDKWHELIGDPTYADAILDRIVHNANRVNLTGDSLRRTRARKASGD